jgi:ABC-type sugar transport system ATPase subunit/DNA-binding IclR family transcriptional regulator
MATVLNVENITRRFPGILAVDDVSFSLQKGESLALIGENGAGKSTLTSVIGGVLKPDKGRIFLEGKEVTFGSSHDAISAGISMVFQELSLVGSLSIAENIFANRQPVGKFNTIRWRLLYEQTNQFLKKFNLDLDPKIPVKNLSMGQQQILEILKAISTNPKVLILDEPTSSLTEGETNYLFENIRVLQQAGMSFIYITHKLPELFQITNRVVVMRDGKYVGSRKTGEVTEDSLVAMMVGREISKIFGEASKQIDDKEYFRVKEFSRKGVFKNINFGLRRGEILGIAGLVGAGRTDLVRSIFGIDPKDSGNLFLNGEQIDIRRPRDAIKKNIAYLTEDRKGIGLFLGMPIIENIIATSLQNFTSSIGFLKAKSIDRYVSDVVKDYSIATPSLNKKVLNLSGGNQQKCLLAMWMGITPKVLLFDEPTRGVDVGARSEIYQKLRELASTGTGIILVSSELAELIGMCDRILVMHEGNIKGEVMPEDFSEELILSLAAGVDLVGRHRSLAPNLWVALKNQAHPILQKLSIKTKRTVHLAVLDDVEVVYIDKIEPIKKVSMYSRIDRRGPAYCTGVGKALLAWSPLTIIDRVCGRLVRFTDNTITDQSEMHRSLQEIQKQGYALDNEEHEKDIVCVAAPIRDSGGPIVAAISVTCTGIKISEERFSSYKPLVMAAAEEISRNLNLQPS